MLYLYYRQITQCDVYNNDVIYEAFHLRLKISLIRTVQEGSFVNVLQNKYFFFLLLFVIFILHSRESELYRYTLDGKSALAWELPFLRFMGHLSST